MLRVVIHVAWNVAENAEDPATVAALTYGAKRAIAKVRDHLPGVKTEIDEED